MGAEKDAVTSLRAPTHYGRPNWDRVFGSIAEKHPETDVGVVCPVALLIFPGGSINHCLAAVSQFFCGPAALSKQLHICSNKFSTPKGTKFFFGKGAFGLAARCFRVVMTPCLVLQRTSKSVGDDDGSSVGLWLHFMYQQVFCQ